MRGYELVHQAKEDIEKYNKKIIEELPTYREYSESSGLSERAVKHILTKGLTQEERELRLKVIRRQTGIKSWENLPEERKKEYRERFKNFQFKGVIAEDVLKSRLESEDWKVFKIVLRKRDKLGGWANPLNPKLEKELWRLGKIDLLGELKEMNDEVGVRLPDFVSIRGSEILITEVKNQKDLTDPNSPKQHISQHKVMDRLCNLGYACQLENVLVDPDEMERLCEKYDTSKLIFKYDDGDLTICADGHEDGHKVFGKLKSYTFKKESENINK